MRLADSRVSLPATLAGRVFLAAAVLHRRHAHKHKGQHGEDKRLDEANEELEGIEWQRQELGEEIGHDDKDDFSSEDVAE